MDPATGSMSNDGSSGKPWSTLEAVFSANKKFAAGDEILLYSGYHGAPNIKGDNSAVVFIRPAAGATPRLRNLSVNSASRWDISGLDICPENSAAGTTYTDRNGLVYVAGSSSRITLRDCDIRGADSIAGWGLSDWDDKVGRAFRSDAPYTVLADSRISNCQFALSIQKPAKFSSFTGNTIRNFSHDAIVALADDCLYEGNTVTEAYVNNDDHSGSQHDDFFQSWSTTEGVSGTGTGTVYRVTVRGNKFISATGSSGSHRTDPHGLGLFDGYFEGWVIENNLVVTDHYHGISVYGAINCRIVNNTVVENPFSGPHDGMKPWIKIEKHKTRTTPASGNVIRNNISASAIQAVSGSSTLSHNLTTTSYSTHFTDHAALDFSLKSTSPAKDAGSTTDAPATDITGFARTAPYDLGAYEFRSSSGGTTPGITYAEWLVANNLPVDGSGLGAKTANPSGDGVVNEMKFALGIPVTAQLHGGRITTGTAVVSSQRYLTLTFAVPEPAPEGASYSVKAGANLSTWSSSAVIETSNTVAGGLRTRTYRDTVAMGGGGKRFIRLEATAP
ncbi:right-handed parallel beta-helix repeat-containing protein [Luteolibacter flavescens]|uniref:Right-handed parallel beta-helix repeat-containing protein n=1 Tax=Luteolibacter flavescens TaxID=1859460 RepID=A0ABT3FJ65_9BACT|nr:right-handed parallel beta-helix repeat-containing protein [Luteolibacter flavescens]MCW1883598.1 right-handed parallel beta-helix repeat-containing protein [Luteolibacter flavescens]